MLVNRAILGAALMLAAAPVVAQDALLEARANGLVGERFDGYLGVSGTISPTARAQVAGVNIKRRALFSDLAGRRGVTAQDVGIAAACTLLARVAVGEAFQLDDEQWRRRAPGAAAPRPDYCGRATSNEAR